MMKPVISWRSDGFQRAMRTVHLLVVLWIAGCFWISGVLAADATVSAVVDRTQTTLMEPVVLRITVKGAEDVPAPALPAIAGFDTQYVGPQTQITVVNGRYSRSITHVYRLYPKQTGDFRIPAIPVTADGKIYHTNPITIKVDDNQAQGRRPVRLSDKIFLRLDVDPPHPYQNQAVTVRAKLYVSPDLSIQDVGLKQFDHDGFLGEALTFVGRGREIVDGRAYDVYHYHTVMTPVRSGALTVGPCVLRVNVMMSSEPEQEWDSLFGDDLFSAFFRKVEVRPLDVKAPPLSITVREWPRQNRPADFSGAVGRFTIEGSLTPTEVAVGEPVTVRIRVSGKGNLDVARLPAYRDVKGFKVYDPQISTDGNGAKEIEQILIPTDEGVTEVPPLRFVFFDPEKGAYQTVQVGPFPLTVKPAAPGSPQSMSVSSDTSAPAAREQAASFGEDIVYIKSDPGRWIPLTAQPIVMWRPCLIGLSVEILLALGGGVWWRSRRDVIRRRRRTYLKSLERIVRHGQTAGDRFYIELEPVLRLFLSDVLNCPPSSLTSRMIKEAQLEPLKGNEGFLLDLCRLWDRCESVRYGRTAVSEEQRAADVNTTRELIRCARRWL